MKKILTIICVAFTFASVKAQTTVNNKIGQSFVTTVSVVVHPYDDKTKKVITSIHYLLNDNTKFFVYDVTDSGYMISVWDFGDNVPIPKHKGGATQALTTPKHTKNYFYNLLLGKKPDTPVVANNEPYKKPLADSPFVANNEYYKMRKRQVGMSPDTIIDKNGKSLFNDTTVDYIRFRDLAYVDEWGNNMKFFISLKDFNDKCESTYPKSRSFTWGFLTLPIKARIFKPFTFEEKVNFGISFGEKWQRPSTVYSAHSLLFGVSISNVKVDSLSARHYSTALNNTSAFTFSGGYMYQYDKFQIGVFMGLDYISGNSTIGWKYQGVPWLGVGLGLSLFSENKTAPPDDQSQADHN